MVTRGGDARNEQKTQQERSIIQDNQPQLWEWRWNGYSNQKIYALEGEKGMIFWIFVFALCVGIVFCIISSFSFSYELEFPGLILTATGGFVGGIMLVIIIISYSLAPSHEAQNRVRYETVNYSATSYRASCFNHYCSANTLPYC